jgi:enterochelin esterase family protein
VQDGNNDQENPKYGSWPLANIRMANALKLKGYDFGFSFGVGPHTQSEGAAEFAEEMTWLWRGYDLAKSAETFVQDPAEGEKPPFRVGIVNRKP